jgi:UDP-N-acetylglucosamine 2-epimerase (non-hydrolysing)
MDVLGRLGLAPRSYVLVTAHRSENVDHPPYLLAILSALGEIHRRFKVEVVYPMYPRMQSKLGDAAVPAGIRIMKPLGFYVFNRLYSEAFCVLSDSGTAPEEAYFWKRPCVCLRMATERPETVEGGAHIVAGMDPVNIVESVETVVRQGWGGTYDLEEGSSPSSVVVNCLGSGITNFF